MNTEIKHKMRIVIVGGGAGGLELITKLSRATKKRQDVELILVDKNRTHVWKPLFHEVAAGIIDKVSDGVDYRMHAVRFGYRFEQGELSQLAPSEKELFLNPTFDSFGEEIVPARKIEFDILVLSFGSVSNDFGIDGVNEHSCFLDSLQQAEKFHGQLLSKMLSLESAENKASKLKIAIVGAGATGTELAAELHHTIDLAKSYGMPNLTADRLQISLIEAGDRILPALPLRISNSAMKALSKLGVSVLTNKIVTKACKTGFTTKDGMTVNCDMMVWAAGIKIPEHYNFSEHFETNKINQIVVLPTLQSTTYHNVFAIGDCCGLKQQDGNWVPPRAQSAHQMANTLTKNIIHYMDNEELINYVYKDYGSLINLSRYNSMGSLMGNLTNGAMFIEGKLARLFYVSLYHMHQLEIHGKMKGLLVIIFKRINRIVSFKLKLH